MRKLASAIQRAPGQLAEMLRLRPSTGPADLDRNTSLLEQALQQVEQVYRGMAMRIAESEIMRLAFANAHELSTVESRINGSTGWHVSFGVPIVLSKAVSSSAGVGHGLAENRGRSVAEGESRGQAAPPQISDLAGRH